MHGIRSVSVYSFHTLSPAKMERMRQLSAVCKHWLESTLRTSDMFENDLNWIIKKKAHEQQQNKLQRVKCARRSSAVSQMCPTIAVRSQFNTDEKYSTSIPKKKKKKRTKKNWINGLNLVSFGAQRWAHRLIATATHSHTHAHTHWHNTSSETCAHFFLCLLSLREYYTTWARCCWWSRWVVGLFYTIVFVVVFFSLLFSISGGL